MSTIVFYPWLRLKEEVKIEDVKLVHFARGRLLGYNKKAQDICDKILSCYLLNGNISVSESTLLLFGKKSIFEDLSDSEKEYLFALNELIAFSGLSRREYFQPFNYCNRDNFTLVIQSFKKPIQGFAIVSRRKDGKTTNYVVKNAYKMIRPEHISANYPVELDVPLLTTLIKAKHKLKERWLFYSDALFDFNRANTDSDQVSQHHELVMTVGAFQRILDSGFKKEKLVKSFINLFTPIKNLDVQKSIRIKNPIYNTLSETWISDLYELRNDYAHGRKSSTKKCLWKVHEHLLLASYVFPLLVKRRLENDGFYSLTDNDRSNINVFENLADVDLFTEPKDQKNSEDWPWKRIRESAKWEETSEKFKKTLINSIQNDN